MNILTITENFTLGGLETHIIDQYNQLRKYGDSLYIVHGEQFYPETINRLQPHKSFGPLKLGPSVTAQELYKSVEVLKDIISTYHIDVVHAHPYTSLIPAVFAASQMNTPLVITLHGPSAFTNVYGPIYLALLKEVVIPSSRYVLCVSMETLTFVKTFSKKQNCVLLPNCIDIGLFTEVSRNPDGPWLIVSRLDPYKVEGIKDFLLKADSSGLPYAIVVGDGPSFENLKEFSRTALNKTKVEFLGAKYDVHEILKKGISGIGGMGRVVLEGMASNLPTMLIGYEGVKGVVSINNVDIVSWWNFSGRGMPSISQLYFDYLIKNLDSEEYRLRNWVESNANSLQVWKQYRDLIVQLKAQTSQDSNEIIDLIWDALKRSATASKPYLEDISFLRIFDNLLNIRSEEGINSKFLVSVVESLKQGFRDSHLTISRLIEERGELQHSLEESKREISRLIEERGELQHSLEESKREISRLIEERGELQHSLEESKREISRLIEERGELQHSLEESKREISRLIEERGELHKELSEISRLHETLTDKIKEIESSRMWKVTKTVWGIRQKIVPRNSKREKIIRKIYLLFRKSQSSEIGYLNDTSSDFSQEPIYSDLRQEPIHKNIELWEEIRAHKILRKGRIIPNRFFSRKRIAYFTNQLLDWYDERPRYGGGERYCVTLASLLQDLGFDVDIYQVASHPFVGEYEGFRVTAIPHGEFYSEFNIGAANKFFEISLNYDHVIYNLPEYSSGPMRIDAISICHGIWFDHTFYGNFWTNEWFKHLYRAFKNPKRIISVDTNSINVIRAFWPELAHKFVAIPNFVDHSIFNRRDFLESKDRDIFVVFPRRANPARGALIVRDILRFVKYDHVQFYWIGEGDGPFNQYLIELSNLDRRFRFLTASFHEMPDWYKKADIVVIPTLGSEGTSLSCLEAIASGCAVVVTNVGGLTDIIRDGWNGLVVPPNPKEIAKAINRLIEDDNLRRELSERAYVSSYEFSLEKWRNAWTEVFYEEGWLSRRSSKPSIVNGRDSRIVIVTKNAIHGGVETLIALEAKYLNATVIVAGGYNDPFNTCPFNYKYVSTYEELIKALREYDIVLYHWPMEWAVQAIKDSGLPSVEFVHREDTSELDKSVPDLIVTHSTYLASKLEIKTGKKVFVVPHGIELKRKINPSDYEIDGQKRTIVGMITSYEETKGVDLFIAAWAMIAKEFPSYKAALYGAGSKLQEYIEMAKQFGVDIEFNGPTSRPLETLNRFVLLVHPSRVEGLPVTILEALSLNIPVIASNIEGHIQINLIAEENGFGSPLILFESENIEDLAGKMRNVLKNPANKVTSNFVESCFSPKAHIEPLISILYDLRKRPRRTEILYDCIDYSLNEGVFFDDKSTEGFLFTSFNANVFANNKLSLTSTSSMFLSYRYPIPKDTEYIECKINLQETQNIIVKLRFDWYYKDQVLAQNYFASVPGDGVVYARAKVPSDLLHRSELLLITIVPPNGQSINVKELEIRALKRREPCIEP
ncbi:glycosyltransferase [Thermanaerothrix sp. 4228-RoL]|uniref:Glycosyltransferase n=1 Tax=Thermanaerothrix solaris TaxID=3058434 RepID=A0ABU3NM14_9CHLR|nr:glycosyltransferase [Thermanaerothrix sp. 4228-RoL]MDT8897883.1 glycosyltransferase [Thermanaerothrix sp. 4228-RoL]